MSYLDAHSAWNMRQKMAATVWISPTEMVLIRAKIRPRNRTILSASVRFFVRGFQGAICSEISDQIARALPACVHIP